MQEINTLEFIKKSRPKINIGDIFVFKIKNRFYVGLVIHNQLIEKYGNNTMFTLLVSKYYENKIENINSNKLIQFLEQEELLLPPINLNKKGWLNGFFMTIENIDVTKVLQKKILDKCRFIQGGISNIFNINHELTTTIESLSFVGRIGTYNDKGFEFLIQISLDLEFSDDDDDDNDYNPYGYYDELKEEYPNLELPYWYHKAKSRLNR